MNFPTGICHRKHCLQSHLFLRNQHWRVILCFRWHVTVLLYWLLCLELFFYQRVSVFLLHELFLTLAHSSKPICKDSFLTKTCFFIHITHFSINFTWFTLLSSQTIDDRTLIKLYLTHCHWIASKQIFF